MKYMFIVTSAQMAQPTPALMKAMAELTAREVNAGRMVDNAGLMPLSMGARVSISDGELMVSDGPFAETKEMIDRKSTRLNSSHNQRSRMPSSA